MFFGALSLAEFLALFGAISALVVTLYLLDRSRRKQMVATLRFWTASERSPEVRHRRHIQQPWSLLLQILGILLLLLAVAQLRWGSPDYSSRDHVLIVDCSAWMSARGARGTLMDQARELAVAYVRALPRGDRLMLVRADALPTPATGFETDREVLIRAIRAVEASASALDLSLAFDFAERSLSMGGSRRGEIVFAGAGRTVAQVEQPPPNLRILKVNEKGENCGIRKVGLRRAAKDADLWEIYVSARNYGASTRTVGITLYFGNAPIGARKVTIPAGGEQSATFQYRTRAAGWLEARLNQTDNFPEDDRAVLELPEQQRLIVAVYTNDADLFRPVLAADSRVEARFYTPAEYSDTHRPDVAILDRFRPERAPRVPSLWIEPPREGSPVPVRATTADVAVRRWRSDHPLGAGLHTEDLRLETAAVFAAAPTDIRVAEADTGPLVVAREAPLRTIVMGFNPVRSTMRYELATPLLFANVLRWMAPDVFRQQNVNVGHAGSVTVPVSSEFEPDKVKVVDEQNRPVPFSLSGRSLRFFAAKPGTVRVQTPEGESVHSLTLPDAGEARWEPPAGARAGLPRGRSLVPPARDLWRGLALLGGLALLVEWMIYGRSRGNMRRVPAATVGLTAWKQRLRKPARKAS